MDEEPEIEPELHAEPSDEFVYAPDYHGESIGYFPDQSSESDTVTVNVRAGVIKEAIGAADVDAEEIIEELESVDKEETAKPMGPDYPGGDSDDDHDPDPIAIPS